MKASYRKHILNFKQPSGTSRGVLRQKETWFIVLERNGELGIGECGILRGLSADDVPEYESKLKWSCENIHLGIDTLYQELMAFPSIQFGLEMAFKSLENDDPFKLYDSKFYRGEEGITINGLIWMGDRAFMQKQIKAKIEQGFSCIKLKIGAIDFETELNLLQSIRKEFSASDIELRVDANGAFSIEDALVKLNLLSKLKLHSIEQPIKAGQFESMAVLCENTPLPIALDEELIGVWDVTKRQELLQTINPQYIILKPSFIGGYRGSENWINLADNLNIGWWITSALESNIGLNAIAQWTNTLESKMPQGLGTGGLFTNNILSPLEVVGDQLMYSQINKWEYKII
ncbi:MAG: o-succinylbenzoate synthase [Bacteroidetes bacterium MedPE-SWsnd-G2]|nr:MAG: o-succinylbenzoate synthase [Bacteroidetes bacterium MedPE-SWsnd-G2]